MNRITFTTIVAVLLLVSFFMPFFYWNSFEMNGFNFILSDRVPSYKYCLLPVPLVVLFYLFGVLSEENTSFSQKLLSWIPVTALIIVIMLVFVNELSERSGFENGTFFSNTGSGLWLAITSSIFLAYRIRPKPVSH